LSEENKNRCLKCGHWKIKQNLVYAFVYNAALIPVAGLGLLYPALAGLAMAASSVSVVSSSLLLKRWKPQS